MPENNRRGKHRDDQRLPRSRELIARGECLPLRYDPWVSGEFLAESRGRGFGDLSLPARKCGRNGALRQVLMR